MGDKSHKCTRCNDIVKPTPPNRRGRCDKCWIIALETTIEYVANKIIDNSSDTLQAMRNGDKLPLWAWRYAITTQYALNLLDAIGKPHEWQIYETTPLTDGE